MNYEIAYRIGFHPWEDAAEQPSFLDREEAGLQPPYGLALDLGTGSGIWGIKLAERGWRVTGVDIVERALDRARDRVREADVEMRTLYGDVTALRPHEVGSGYRLVLDTGTFHGLDEDDREAMGRSVDAVAAEVATVLLIAWEPKRRGPFPRGVSREEVAAAFPGWEVSDAGPSGFEAPKPIELLLRPDERWYRLRRG
jgi:SAM-dependent methyltransferase